MKFKANFYFQDKEFKEELILNLSIDRIPQINEEINFDPCFRIPRGTMKVKSIRTNFYGFASNYEKHLDSTTYNIVLGPF